ncbi:MAG TPA: hypothetical protein V6D25_00040 [Leptolyngbyaceae cyanobacterium]
MYCNSIAIPAPYKGLIPYSQTDKLFFFGREKEQQIVIQNLRASQLTILYGASGVGKSSLLRAGVAYDLRQAALENLEKNGKPGWSVIVFPPLNGELNDSSSWDEPLKGIQEQLKKEITDLFKTTKLSNEIEQQFEQEIKTIALNQEEPSFSDILKAWIEIVRKENEGGRLFIILDQFEEYFDSYNSAKDTFTDEFSQAVNDSDLNIHFLISIREDALAKLDHFKGHIYRNLLDNRLAIKHLNRQSAEDAIKKPISEYNRQQTILDSLCNSKLTILYGDSRAGKSTILRDGIAYYLHQAAAQNTQQYGKPKLVVTLFNSWRKGKPLDNLLSQIKKSIKDIGNIEVPHLDLSFPETLQAWAKLIDTDVTGKIFIIIDQFEEYLGSLLRHHQRNEIDSFLVEAFHVLNYRNLNIHLLICLHENKIDVFKDIAKKYTDNYCKQYLYLDSDKIEFRPVDNSIDVISFQSDKNKSVKLDEDLVTSVLDDIKSEKTLLEVLSEESYETAYLQLIMLRLWKHEMTGTSPSYKLQEQTYKQTLGGAEKIVQKHLNEKLEELKNDEKIEPETSYSLFNYLVTPSKKNLALTSSDLYNYTRGELNQTEELDEEKIKRWLTKLSKGESRILRRLPVDEYEIFLNILVNAIWNQLQRQRKIQEIEQIAKNAWSQFDSSQLEALLQAMQTGQKFQEDIKQGHLKDYYAPQLKSTLQNILDNIREENQFQAHKKPIHSVCFSPDGQQLATGSADGTACLWDLQGNPIGEPFPHGDDICVWSVCFSPDGQQLATGSTDGIVCLWDLQGNRISKLFQVCSASQSHDNWVLSVKFSPDGQQLATGCADGTVCLWDLQGNQIGEPFLDHQGWVWSVSFSRSGPDAKYFAAGCADGTVCRWNWKSNKNPPYKHEVGGTVYDISFSPDEKYLAAASSDGKVYVWDLESDPNKRIECRGHQCWVYSVNFSHDSKYLATGSADGTVRLWDLKNIQMAELKQIAEFKDHKGFIWSVSFSLDGHLATSSTDGTVRLWRLTDNQQAKFLGHKSWVYSVSFSPDGKHFATGCADGKVYLWDLEGNQIGEPFLVNHPVLTVAFSPDGKKLATGSEDKTARLWNLQGHQIGEPFSDHKDWVWSVSFSPDGQQLATASADGFVRLWDIHSHKLTKLEPNKNGKIKNSVWSVSFSPDGQQLATGSDDASISLWDLQSNIQRTFPGRPDLPGHKGSVWSVSFSCPDGEQLVSGSADGTVCLWNLKEQDLKKQLLQKFQAHNDWVWSVSFSPDGQHFATGSADGTARLWDLKGQLVQEFKDHKGTVYSVNFSPDGKQLATASTNGTVKLWSIEYDLKPILAKGCNWLKNYFVKHPEKKNILTICCDS